MNIDLGEFKRAVYLLCSKNDLIAKFEDDLNPIKINFYGRNRDIGETWIMFDFNKCTNNMWTCISYVITHLENIKVLNKEDIDWSDFMKYFTKKDLKSGDVVLSKNGVAGIVICGGAFDVIKYNHGVSELKCFSDDLTYSFNDNYSIKAVRRPKDYDDISFNMFDFKSGTLVYERKEVEEMTLEEVCKALGKEIKIVKK